MIEHLINKIQKEDLEIMFGKGSNVIIDSVTYSTNKKQFVIHSTLNATYYDIVTEVFDEGEIHNMDMYPAGLNVLIQEGWKYIGINKNITIINRINII